MPPTSEPEKAPPAPGAVEPDKAWEHFDLWKAVTKTIYSLPLRFESDLVVSGVLATDLFAFNASLAATIEEQVVSSLNKLRTIWDANQKYGLYAFERRPQTFPDVVLKAAAPGVKPEILMGIELKGWYVLAKEREPSFRYKATPAVCAPADLLVVVPWALSNVISGSPRVFEPFVLGAKNAAAYRNWWWEHEKGGTSDNTITLSAVTTNYPSKSDMISDKPNSDSGGNFGRIARTGLMDDYMTELFGDRLAGIPLSAWQQFLAIFAEGRTADQLDTALSRLSRALANAGAKPLKPEAQEQLVGHFQQIATLLEPD